MTQEQAKWLVEVWNPRCYQRIWRKEVPGMSFEAERIMKGWEHSQPRSCTCHYKAAALQINSLYDQNEQLILQTAYPERYATNQEDTQEGSTIIPKAPKRRRARNTDL